MTDRLVNIETAKLAFRRGFDYPTSHYCWSDRDYVQRMCDSNHGTELHKQKMYSESKKIFTISVPTQSLL